MKDSVHQHTINRGIRARTAALLDLPQPGDDASRFVDIFVISLIVINIIAMTLETVASIRASWTPVFAWIELFSVVAFSVEYVARVWSIVDNPFRAEYRHRIWGRLRFMASPMAVIDLLAVLPFWLQILFPVDLRFLRIVRLLRVLKLTRYSAATNLLFDVVREKARVLGASMFMIFLLLLFAATTSYMLEHEAQPEAFSSIPAALWWCVVTVTTVGYGDVVPVTNAGKVLGSLLGFIGVAMVALPAGILSAGFSDSMSRRRESLRQEVEEALSDNVVDTEEREEIELMGHRLSLSRQQVEAILAEYERPSNTSSAEGNYCPQCGRNLASGMGSGQSVEDHAADEGGDTQA